MTSSAAAASAAGPLVLLGGTFDPPHRAHHALLRAAGAALHMTQNLQLLIAADPWQKQGITAYAQRLAMLQLSLNDDSENTHTRITINTIEADYQRDHKNPTYSINTLQRLREQYQDLPIVFVLGWDQWLKLTTWHQWQSLTDYAHLCIAPRVNAITPGVKQMGSASEALTRWSQAKLASAGQLCEKASGCIYQLPEFAQAMSSTQLRELLAKGRYNDAALWLYPSVLRYIEAYHLYQEKQN